MAIEVSLIGGDRHGAGMLDDDLAARYQHLVEGQWGDVGSARSTERVAPGLERSAVATTFACSLHQRDVAPAASFERSDDLDDGSDDQARSADQRARRCRPAVDVHEVGWRRIEHSAQQVADRDGLVHGGDRNLGFTLRCRDDQVHISRRGRSDARGSGTVTGLMMLLSVRQVHGITSKFKTTSSF